MFPSYTFQKHRKKGYKMGTLARNWLIFLFFFHTFWLQLIHLSYINLKIIATQSFNPMTICFPFKWRFLFTIKQKNTPNLFKSHKYLHSSSETFKLFCLLITNYLNLSQYIWLMENTNLHLFCQHNCCTPISFSGLKQTKASLTQILFLQTNSILKVISKNTKRIHWMCPKSTMFLKF